MAKTTSLFIAAGAILVLVFLIQLTKWARAWAWVLRRLVSRDCHSPCTLAFFLSFSIGVLLVAGVSLGTPSACSLDNDALLRELLGLNVTAARNGTRTMSLTFGRLDGAEDYAAHYDENCPGLTWPVMVNVRLAAMMLVLMTTAFVCAFLGGMCGALLDCCSLRPRRRRYRQLNEAVDPNVIRLQERLRAERLATRMVLQHMQQQQKSAPLNV